MQRVIQFQQRPFIQRDKAGARCIDVRNYCNDNGDENWKTNRSRMECRPEVPAW
jgi:hypothetical protein